MFLQNVSIPTKMVLLACSSAGLALLMACVGFAWHGVNALRDAKGKQLRDQAQLIAFQAAPLVALRDQERGEKLLASLQWDKTLEEARLYGNNRKVIASWGDQHSVTAPSVGPKSYHFIGLSHVEALYPVTVGARQLGEVYLRANTSDLQAQLMKLARIAVTLMAISMLSAILISMRLQRAVSRPILDLTEAAENISTNGDYSIRVAGNAGGELRCLQETFNRMLAQIAKSEKAVQAAQNGLEERVKARTEELTQEVCRRREIQIDLETAKDAAEAASRAKSEFLANMSHEIRTPLNGIMGFTELLLRDSEQITREERGEHLTTVYKSGCNLVELINDILDVSKIEAGHFEVERIAFSPHQIISEVVSVLRVRAKEKNLDLEYQSDSPLPATIHSDPSRFRQLVMNLVSNAIKFTEDGEIRIAASLTKTTPQHFQIDVTDTGIGIPSEKLEQIFDPFTQADTSVTRRFGGTGLGLAISRKITAALAGKLTVESNLGVGSTFTATIDPGELSDVEIVCSESLSTGVPDEHPSKPITLPGTRILVVDDGETNRKLIRLILTRSGADVLCAENGLEAIKVAESAQLDLILMDMQMPIKDGYSATRDLREKGFTLPILAITAHAMKGDKDKCIAAGCSGYLTKPVDATNMLRQLASSLSPNEDAIASLAFPPSPSPAFPPSPSPAFPPSPVTTVERTAALQSSLPMDDLEFREIVVEFVDRFGDRLGEMKAAHTANSFDELAFLAHWLKGAGGTAGFNALTDPAKGLETAAKVCDMTECEKYLNVLEDLASQIEIPMHA